MGSWPASSTGRRPRRGARSAGSSPGTAGASRGSTASWPTCATLNTASTASAAPTVAPGTRYGFARDGQTPEAWDHLSPTSFVETWSDALERAPIVLTADGRRLGDWLPLQADALADSTPGRVRAPMHLPHALAVHRVTVKSLRVEPVTSISEADAKAEGVDMDGPDLGPLHRPAFFSLWDDINRRRGLGVDACPWVWVVEMSEPRAR